MDKTQLAKRVKETSYLEGDFVLRSGKRSKYYMDKYPLKPSRIFCGRWVKSFVNTLRRT